MGANRIVTMLTIGTLGTAAIAADAKGLFNPESFTLDNGMEVVVIPNHRAPVVHHSVWYRVGSADSPEGQSGIPHFLEHLMFKGTNNLEPGEFSKTVALNGGNDNAFTSPDVTAYHQTIASDRLSLMMEMEADRMVNLQLSDEVVLPERDVVIEERLSRVDNDPHSRFAEALNAAQFMHHPYRMPVIGWMHEIEEYDREKALAFYERYYAPNNAILIVSGDITAEELRPMAEATYGKIPAGEPEERMRVTEPPAIAARRLEMRDPRVRQPSIIKSYTAPSHTAGASEHAYSLSLLSEILGGSATSRLYRSMVIDTGKASSSGAYYRGGSLDLTTFRLYASPRGDTSLDELEDMLDAEIQRVIDEGVTQDELDRVRDRMIAQAIYARDSLSGVARIFGMALTNGRTIEDVEGWPEAMAEVTPESIQAAAKAVFVESNSVTGRLMPANVQPAQEG